MKRISDGWYRVGIIILVVAGVWSEGLIQQRAEQPLQWEEIGETREIERYDTLIPAMLQPYPALVEKIRGGRRGIWDVIPYRCQCLLGNYREYYVVFYPYSPKKIRRYQNRRGECFHGSIPVFDLSRGIEIWQIRSWEAGRGEVRLVWKTERTGLIRGALLICEDRWLRIVIDYGCCQEEKRVKL